MYLSFVITCIFRDKLLLSVASLDVISHDMQGQRYMQDQMSNDVISLHFSIFDSENLKNNW